MADCRWERTVALCTVGGVILSFIATGLSYWQLRSSIASLQQTNADISMAAATSYLNSPGLIHAKEIINKNTKNGSDYVAVPSNPELYNAVVAVLNHLETILTGVDVGHYSESIICKSLRAVVIKQVEVHLKGQRPVGVSVTNPQPFSSTECTERVIG